MVFLKNLAWLQNFATFHRSLLDLMHVETSEGILEKFNTLPCTWWKLAWKFSTYTQYPNLDLCHYATLHENKIFVKFTQTSLQIPQKSKFSYFVEQKIRLLRIMSFCHVHVQMLILNNLNFCKGQKYDNNIFNGYHRNSCIVIWIYKNWCTSINECNSVLCITFFARFCHCAIHIQLRHISQSKRDNSVQFTCILSKTVQNERIFFIISWWMKLLLCNVIYNLHLIISYVFLQ